MQDIRSPNGIITSDFAIPNIGNFPQSVTNNSTNISGMIIGQNQKRGNNGQIKFNMIQ